MKLKFLADADLNKSILTGLLRREPAIDFLSAPPPSPMRKRGDSKRPKRP
jgi:hypothetical protein